MYLLSHLSYRNTNMNNSYIIAFWSPFPISASDYCMDFLSSFLKHYGDIQCLDCKSSFDSRTLRLMQQADLVVIGLHQNYREICDYFCRVTCKFSNYIYVIVDYFPEQETSLLRIAHEFRIPLSRITCIPYDANYHEAVRTGCTERHRKSRNTRRICPACMDFRKELIHSALLILKALEAF